MTKQSPLLNFNPRPRKEGDRYHYVYCYGTGHFNPRPRKEGDHTDSNRGGYCRYFNPRPRKEGDGLCLWETLANVDFNPRPRKEGDRFCLCDKLPCAISIHALVKRATALPQAQFAQNFISIHALVKRATFYICINLVFILHFNPRPRKEGDRDHIIRPTEHIKFQSTPS